MSAILGLGVTHSPTFSRPAYDMSYRLRQRLLDPDVPEGLKDPGAWPALMQAEWSDDQGARAAAIHHAAMAKSFQRVRAALDEFAPDFILIWGDDQYENFKEDIIPAFCLLAYEEVTARPWESHVDHGAQRLRQNIWGEPPETEFRVRCHRAAATYLSEKLLAADFDVAYAYRPLHYPGLSHAFLNPVLFLDAERRGFPYRILPFQINCYGRKVVAERGLTAGIRRTAPPDPPSPSPRRCFDLGAAVATACRESPWRVALMASSSWSHAFLVQKTYRLWPDLAFDRELYAAMQAGNYAFWREQSLAAVEDAGGHETLNWFALMGAMHALKTPCVWSECLETYVFNATKVTAIFAPVSGGSGAERA